MNDKKTEVKNAILDLMEANEFTAMDGLTLAARIITVSWVSAGANPDSIEPLIQAVSDGLRALMNRYNDMENDNNTYS